MAIVLGLNDRERHLHSRTMADLAEQAKQVSELILDSNKDMETFMALVVFGATGKRFQEVVEALTQSLIAADVPDDAGGLEPTGGDA